MSDTPFVSICAWCERERTLTVLDGTPAELALIALEADEVSHGICPEHKAQALKEAGL